MEENKKLYEKRARLYPVIIATLIPFGLFVVFGSSVLNIYNELERVWNIIISVVPASLITAATVYGVKNLARSTSKALFQFPMFQEDESEMPTTEFLLYSNSMLSRQNKTLIRDKIKHDIGLVLLDEEQEKLHEREARQLIVDAVKQIRERTRGNQILFDYNCNLGFVRNFMGANVWSLIITIILTLFNFFASVIDTKVTFGATLIIILLFPVAFYLLKLNGREYARQLYTAYMENV